jgi:hypothetical protein
LNNLLTTFRRFACRATSATLVGALALVGSTRVTGNELFAPPPVPAQEESLRTAYDPRTHHEFQPQVLRFGLFPPAPLQQGVAGPQLFEPPAPPQASAANGTGEPLQKLPAVGELHHPPQTDCRATESPYYSADFSCDPVYDHIPWDTPAALSPYGEKHLVPVQRPLVEWGMPFYDNGPVPPSGECLGPTNLTQPKFYVYGDYRVGAAQNQLATGEQTVLAHRLNLEVDLWLTATERFHMFTGPFQEGNAFMRVEEGEFFNEFDFFDPNTDTLYFEGDLGQIWGGIEGTYAPFDMPIAVGLVPLLFQNGIWMQDAMVGAAVTLPARNSAALDWSNYDITFFTAFDKVSTGALPGDEDGAQLFGATTFIEARGGYFEAGYAFVNDTRDDGRSYNNIGLSYTRRYFNRLSNSMRVITNFGQEGPQQDRTADGVLLLMENSLITENPYNIVPYVNFFAGFDRPQPAARAAVFGGVLFNTGILFQSDALTGYPTLDPTGHDTYGAAFGLDLLAPDFGQQLIVEAAILQVHGDATGRSAPGDQYGIGARYQIPITNAHLLRFDAMHGWLENSRDISGVRGELRWKF